MRFRQMILAAPVAAALSLGGCASTGGGLDPAFVDQVRAAATAACGFLPTAETVLGIIGTISGTGPIAATVSGIANAICQAVTAKAGARAGSPPMVNGIIIHGRFVR